LVRTVRSFDEIFREPFGVRASSGTCPKRSASSRAPARGTPTKPLVATESLYASVLLVEIRDAWAVSLLVRLLATDHFQTHRAATRALIPLEICAQLAKDLCKRVSVAARQRIGRCAREIHAPCNHAFEHCFWACAGLIR
jgi:hypothetical protein